MHDTIGMTIDSGDTVNKRVGNELNWNGNYFLSANLCKWKNWTSVWRKLKAADCDGNFHEAKRAEIFMAQKSNMHELAYNAHRHAHTCIFIAHFQWAHFRAYRERNSRERQGKCERRVSATQKSERKYLWQSFYLPFSLMREWMNLYKHATKCGSCGHAIAHTHIHNHNQP